jgi:hypothetical protein
MKAMNVKNAMEAFHVFQPDFTVDCDGAYLTRLPCLLATPSDSFPATQKSLPETQRR